MKSGRKVRTWTREEAFTSVITTERVCERWFEHMPGFDPRNISRDEAEAGELERVALEQAP